MVRGISTAITVRRAAALAIAGAAATALAACGAGQVTQTDTKQSAVAGVNVDEGDLALRDLQIEFDSAEGFASGDDAALRVWIGNEGEEEISLTAVVVAAEIGTVTFVSPTGQAEAAEAASSEPAEETSADDDDADESAEESSSPAEAATTPAADLLEGETTFEPIAIAPAGYIRLDESVEDGDYFLIEDLGEGLSAGDTVTVVFRFSNGEEVEVDLPIGLPLEDESRSYFEPEEEAEGH